MDFYCGFRLRVWQPWSWDTIIKKFELGFDFEFDIWQTVAVFALILNSIFTALVGWVFQLWILKSVSFVSHRSLKNFTCKLKFWSRRFQMCSTKLLLGSYVNALPPSPPLWVIRGKSCRQFLQVDISLLFMTGFFILSCVCVCVRRQSAAVIAQVYMIPYENLPQMILSSSGICCFYPQYRVGVYYKIVSKVMANNERLAYVRKVELLHNEA